MPVGGEWRRDKMVGLIARGVLLRDTVVASMPPVDGGGGCATAGGDM